MTDKSQNDMSKKSEKRLVAGLTGGFSSGKTTAAEMFAVKGARIIDADKITRDLLKSNARIKGEIIDFFGGDIAENGKIIRKKLSDRVFNDKKGMEALCRILHPEIIKKIKARVKEHASGIVIVDAPLLIESGMDSFVDVVILVSASEENQIEKAGGRGISQKKAKSIIQNQMPLSEKIKFADYIIENNEKMDNLKKGVEQTWKKLKEKKKNWILCN